MQILNLFFAICVGFQIAHGAKREFISDLDNNDLSCIPRDFGRGSIVCVCNSTYCDTSSLPSKPSEGQFGKKIWIFTSSKNGERMKRTTINFNQEKLEEEDNSLDGKSKSSRNSRLFFFTTFFNQLGDFPRPQRTSKFVIRRRVKYQKIIGFGGAFTDAAGINMNYLSEKTQNNLLKSYFGPLGNDYSVGRIPIGGTDFSTRPYTYNDVEFPDFKLSNFSLQGEDYALKIPYIKKANELASRPLDLLASPWSAPVFMKTNDKLNGAGQLKKEFYQSWADYFARFIEDYKKEGINIWAVTTGNEPLNGFVPRFPFNCMGWRAKDMREWIRDNLGPAMQKLGVKILIFDDNKGGLPTWTSEILGNQDSAKYVSGIGTHWYLDFLSGSEILTRTHEKYPDYFLVSTEACLGFLPWDLEKVILGSWTRGEQYLEGIIRVLLDLNNWVTSWIDWNLALDQKGQPNWAKLAADAAIIVNPEKDEFFKQPIFYALGHASKFIPPESVRIEMKGVNVPQNLKYVAFLRPDNGTTLLFLNMLSHDAKVDIYDEDYKSSISLKIPAKSMQTMLYW